MKRLGVRRGVALALLTAAMVLIPDAGSAPTRLSLVKVESAKSIDFADGTVWVLALGSDAKGDEGLFDGRADAIELIGLNFETRRAIAIAVPRDSWVDIPGYGFDRINAGFRVEGGGPELMAELVGNLLRITPDYVFTAGFEGFASVIDALGGVSVLSERAFDDPEFGISVGVGRNEMDGGFALGYARSRKFLTGDFERAANQQRLLSAILERVRRQEDVPGFIEGGALAVLRGLDTDLPPVELYRFAQAITQIELKRIAMCVITGTDGTVGGRAVIFPNESQATRVGDEARDDATLESGC